MKLKTLKKVLGNKIAVLDAWQTDNGGEWVTQNITDRRAVISYNSASKLGHWRSCSIVRQLDGKKFTYLVHIDHTGYNRKVYLIQD